MTPAPPADLAPIHTRILDAGTVLHRMHDRHFKGETFNPGKGRPSRFAPLFDSAGVNIPTLYAATSMDAAAYESIFHDVPYNAGIKSVPFDEAKACAYSRIQLRIPLTVATLHEPDLNRWGATRAQLIDTPASDYSDTAKWAVALHAQGPNLNGLQYTSKRCDSDQAFVFFGDRSATAFELLDQRVLGEDDALLSQVRAAGKRAGIVLAM
ncbi:MAG TPA: RES domain-containing protein [Caulobacteraceae bacterium]|nr:RES domain-containing protein [Caulobacteraceae bacterium]